MALSTISAEFDSEVEKVWDKVTSLEDYLWRSDLGKIVVLSEGKQFEEHTKEGYVTRFTVTLCKPFERYEFDMENDNMKGHWTGLFFYKDGKTTIEFTEDVTAKKMIMKPFVGAYLKKQQVAYVRDLKKALEGSAAR